MVGEALLAAATASAPINNTPLRKQACCKSGGMLSSQVFDGDIPYLYKQSRNNRMAFRSATGNDWVKECKATGSAQNAIRDPSWHSEQMSQPWRSCLFEWFAASGERHSSSRGLLIPSQLQRQGRPGKYLSSRTSGVLDSCHTGNRVESVPSIDVSRRRVSLLICSHIHVTYGSARRGVVAFRRWFHGKGQGGPPYFNPDKDAFPPASIPREQLLDRWEQHTQHCPSCKKVRIEAVLSAVLAEQVHVPWCRVHHAKLLCHANVMHMQSRASKPAGRNNARARGSRSICVLSRQDSRLMHLVCCRRCQGCSLCRRC